MVFYSNHTFNVSALLTDFNIIELSYNQILDHPANFVFDINFSRNFSIYKKLLILNKIKNSINYKMYFILNPKKLRLKRKDTIFICRQFLFENLILKQIIANVLTKIFKLENKKRRS
jgi:hypothetical protein